MNHSASYSPDDNKIRLTPAHRLDADDYARVKAAGYRWAPMQKVFYAVWSPAAEDIALEMAGEIEDEDKSLVERAEERAERFEGYSENRAKDADQAKAAVDRIADNIPLGQPIICGHHSERHARRDAKRIENGMRKAVDCWEQSKYWQQRAQGALHNAKYKERPDVRGRRIKGIEADLRKVLKTKELYEASLKFWSREDLTHEEALRIAGHTQLAGFSMRDKEGDRALTDPTWTHHCSAYDALTDSYPNIYAPRTLEEVIEAGRRVFPPRIAHIERWVEHYSNRLEYEGAMLKEQIGTDSHAERFDFQIGGKITVQRESAILTILKLNKKDGQLVSVSTNSRRWTRVVPVEDITGYTTPEQGAAEQIKAATKRPTLCNYPGEGFASCTKAEWAKISKDYKSQSHVIPETETAGAHCVRRAIGVWLDWSSMPLTDHDRQYCDGRKHRYYPVFITDEKRKDPPTKETEPAPQVPAIEHDDKQILADLERRITYQAERKIEDAAAAPFEAIKDALKTGVQVVTANQLFPTPPAIVEMMIDVANLELSHDVLEPSAGTGNILQGIMNAANPDGHATLKSQMGTVIACEINQALCWGLRQKFESVDVRRDNFLEWEVSKQFDRILMNPPFENGADIKHIQHAITFLKPGGRLVAICANGPRQQDKLKPLADHWEVLPTGSFKESGTMVNAAIMVYNAPQQPEEVYIPSSKDTGAVSPAAPAFKSQGSLF